MPKPLRIWISRFQNFRKIILILGLLAVLLVFGTWFGLAKITDKLNEQNYFANQPNVAIKTYSLNGTFVSFENNVLILEVGQVVTGKKGNSLEYKKYEVQIPNDTVVKSHEFGSNDFVDASADNLAGAKNITVYTEQNPYNQNNITASRVEITF